MKKTFAALYDVLFVSLISACMYTVSLWIMSRGPVGDLHWYWVIICAVCIAVPTGCIVFGIHKCTIDLVCDRVEIVYLVRHNVNSRDLLSNWVIYPSEIEKVTVVRLSKEEKRRYTSARFLFSQYLKIEMKFGHVKYVYVSHYSNYQIAQIIKLLTSDNSLKT